MKKLLLVATLMAGAAQATAAEKLYLFNWNDYIAEDTLNASSSNVAASWCRSSIPAPRK